MSHSVAMPRGHTVELPDRRGVVALAAALVLGAGAAVGINALADNGSTSGKVQGPTIFFDSHGPGSDQNPQGTPAGGPHP
jgi:hypothetical protein